MKKKMSQAGLEPATNALKEHYSTIELLAHIFQRITRIGNIAVGCFRVKKYLKGTRFFLKKYAEKALFGWIDR